MLRAGLARWALVLPLAVGLGTACSAPDDQGEAASSTSTSTPQGTAPSSSPSGGAGATASGPASASVPPAAGSSAAVAVAELPTGPGSGPVTITYDGLGEADSTFEGQCSHDGPATTLSGTAGGAAVDLVFDPSSVTLTVTDVGLGTSEARLARGDLTVVDGRLTLTAPLLAGDGVIGSVFLDVTCGS